MTYGKGFKKGAARQDGQWTSGGWQNQLNAALRRRNAAEDLLEVCQISPGLLPPQNPPMGPLAWVSPEGCLVCVAALGFLGFLGRCALEFKKGSMFGSLKRPMGERLSAEKGGRPHEPSCPSIPVPTKNSLVQAYKMASEEGFLDSWVVGENSGDLHLQMAPQMMAFGHHSPSGPQAAQGRVGELQRENDSLRIDNADLLADNQRLQDENKRIRDNRDQLGANLESW